jgi:AraC family transcriptional regulator, regulatory protein of adaptative response / DNA-3-methyladenine glycosylase II
VVSVLLDRDRCYHATRSRDARFDGVFFTAVTSTRIYCRPSCPARTPKLENVRFHPTAAAAQAAGFRACLRCRPDAAPGSPEWNLRADLAGRALRLIADGVVDREGVTGLARRLGYSERQLHRQLVAEVGAGPLALARAQRAQTARVLIETTSLTFTDVAFAAGFASVRQFNDTIQAIFARTPTELRRRRGVTGTPAPGTIELRLPHRAPFAAAELLAFLGARAVPGVEEVRDGAYRRTLGLDHGQAVAELRPADGHVACVLRLADVRDLSSAVQRCRRLLDLDADPVAADAHLAADPLLRPLVESVPGRRLPGAVDGPEIAVRAVLGQQVSVPGARTLAGRLVRAHGEPLALPDPALTHVFPTADALAAADPASLPMPASRARALTTMAAALAAGDVVLDPGADRDEAERSLLALPGIGPWTASYVRMRALGDPDAFLPGDLGVRHALAALGADDARAERWRPWRAYAVQHLSASPGAAGATPLAA